MSELKAITRNRRPDKCKHFNGVQHDACDAGVKYEGFRQPNGRLALPCLNDQSAPACDKCVLPTAEEVAAARKLMEERFDNMVTARAAIVAHLGGPWKKGKPGASGAIDCPCCGKPGALHFSRAGYNGHVHARCESAGCVFWME